MESRDSKIQSLSWLRETRAVVVTFGGHGECAECDKDLGCNCRNEHTVHWCTRHRFLESE